MPERAVAVETTIAAPFATVWAALRDPAAIRRWHGWEYDERGGLDGEIDIIYFQGVEADEAAGTLTIADGSRFELEDRGAETVVRVTMPAPAETWDEVYHDVREGWTTFVHQLRFALEEHRAEERRTLRVAGDAPLDVRLDGDRHTTSTRWGERLTGRVAFRTAHQLGLTVDEYGPGLLAVHHGRMVVLTAYGLDDEAFAALADRWS